VGRDIRDEVSVYSRIGMSRASCLLFRLSPFFILSFSSCWFSSNRHPAFVALFIRSSLPFLGILFVSRNVRLMPTVCSHRQFIFIGPVEVRGRVIEDDGSLYHFPLTFLFYAQVGCMLCHFTISSPFFVIQPFITKYSTI